MNHMILLSISLLLSAPLPAATGGPDSGDYVFTDSFEPDGPPYLRIDTSGWESLSLDADDPTALTSLESGLDFLWYGDPVDDILISPNGVLFFQEEGAVTGYSGMCPGDGSDWSGVAALWNDFTPGTLVHGSLGQYPHRVLVMEWNDMAIYPAGDAVTFQAWLVEGRDEVVISLVDVDTDDASWDGGAGASSGIQGPLGQGLEWSCEGGLYSESSAWFGDMHTRPDAREVGTTDMEYRWWAEANYGGRALASGDINGDGLQDLAIGHQDMDEGLVYLVYGPTTSSSLASAAATLRGENPDDFAGYSLAIDDLDGDGQAELVIGAPSNDDVSSSAGAVYLVSGGGLSGEYSLGSDSDMLFLPPSDGGQPMLGASLASPGDLDGDGYHDLLMGSPGDDRNGLEAGAVYIWYGGPLAGDVDLSDADAVFLGSESSLSEQLGFSVAGADIESDGSSDLLLSAPFNDDGAENAGKLYLVSGEHFSGTLNVEDVANASFTGQSTNEYASWAATLADMDGDGQLSILAGSPYGDALGGSNNGLVYILQTPFSYEGEHSLAVADSVVVGTSDSAHLGEALAAGDMDGDGRDDLFLSAPNATAASVSGGGVVYVFTSPPIGEIQADSAEHLLLGSFDAGAAGTALAFIQDWNGGPYGNLALSAPFASVEGGSNNGIVTLWSYYPSFPDEDSDGWVDLEAGALDCDDDDPAVYPGATEIPTNLVDDDCDGWIDGLIKLRERQDWWEWDLAQEWGLSVGTFLGFEETSPGADVSELYVDQGIVLDSAAGITAVESVYGAAPVDSMGAAVGSSAEGELTLVFTGDQVEAISLVILDASCEMLVSATDSDGDLVSDVPFLVTAENRPGGAFLGIQLSRPATTVSIACATDAWGIDEIGLLWAAQTDWDGDGFSENGGDCDDTDASISPASPEILGNGIDDDCDGVVDAGGFTEYRDMESWLLDSDLDPEIIDFEDQHVGVTLVDQYATLGLDAFWGDPFVTPVVDGSYARGSRAAQALATDEPDSVGMTFDEEQAALGLFLLDVEGELEWSALLHGLEVYSGTFSLDSDDVPGGTFVGLLFDLPVDTLVLSASGSDDIFGLDDLAFHSLGLDDADGDGMTESEGDCDDHDATVFPGAEETWYDGLDSDCDGGSDFDADGDGFDLDLGDCDDSDSSVNPEAEETWYDGVDSDCSGGSDYDADGDGHDSSSHGGDDCEDDDSSINPDADEIFGDGLDQNCYEYDEYDADGDGYSSAGASIGGALGEGDCDDGDPAVNPGALETWYDGLDSDCDEGDDFDADGDGYSSDDWGGSDCDDSDDTIHPGTEYDECYDGVDADCSGGSDYDCDGDGHDADFYLGDDCDDDDPATYPGAPDEPGDGVDSDCDGADDFDADHDGYTGTEYGGTDCDDSSPAVHPDASETCGDGIDSDCDGQDDFDCDGDGYDSLSRGGNDCDDSDPSVNPSAEDTCYDGLDSDCDGASDFDCDRDGYPSLDFDGTDCDDDDPSVHPDATDYPYDGLDSDCDGSPDYDLDSDGHESTFYGGDDCDDDDPSIYPGATDTCYDGVDSDCDGASDFDCDGDGHDSTSYGGDDCDDALASVHPDAAEDCSDGLDHDCDGLAYCPDSDADGHSATDYGGDDCDDDDPSVYPGAMETCYDGVDSDCDGASDFDCDGDGHDSTSYGGDDCDDGDPSVHPGSTERWYDGVDSDCDGADDFDQDGDGWTSSTWGGQDCDDTDSSINPEVAEDGCGGGDQDCDGETDEDCYSSRDTGEPADTATGSDTASSSQQSSDSASSQEPVDTGDHGAVDTGNRPGDTSQAQGGGGSSLHLRDSGCSGCASAPAPLSASVLLLLLGSAISINRRK